MELKNIKFNIHFMRILVFISCLIANSWLHVKQM